MTLKTREQTGGNVNCIRHMQKIREVKDRPVILCCPVRNELHNLVRMLPAWSLYCDYIVIADQFSSDGTSEYLQGFDNVISILNKDTDFNENNRIKLMLSAARDISKSSILLFLDADETLSSNVLHSLEWRRFTASPRGTTGNFLWVQLYGSVRRHIARGKVGKPAHQPFAFIDDGREFVNGGVMHGSRGPGFADQTRSFFFQEVVNLHFFLTNRQVWQKKQNWYKLFWHRRGGKYFHNNRNHCAYEKINESALSESPPDWYLEFTRNGIDVSSSENPALMWYDVEILNYMAIHGSRPLWLLDIWNQDWERLRMLASEMGLPDIPNKPIHLPPSYVQKYNELVLGRVNARETARSAYRFLKRKILP